MKKEVFSVAMSMWMRYAISTIAQQEGRTSGDLVRRAISAYLNDHFPGGFKDKKPREESENFE